MDKTFNSSNNVCGLWGCIPYNASCPLAYWSSFVGSGICLILSGKALQAKPGKGTILITESVQNFSKDTLATNSLVSLYTILSKSFCSDLVEFHTSVVLWQSVVSAELVLTVIALKRQVLLFSTICTIKLHIIIKNSS